MVGTGATATIRLRVLRHVCSWCPGIHLPLSVVSSNAVALLDLADQLLSATLNLIQIIIGELAPLLADAPLKLFPLAFQGIFIHVVLQWTKQVIRR